MVETIKKKIHYYYFLARWGLIGKYHCSLPRNKKLGYLANKIVWSIIAFSLCNTLYKVCMICLD